MRSVLQGIRAFHPELKPPKGAVPCGITPDGKQLFRMVSKRSRAVPDIDPETGEQRWRKQPNTGEPLYRMNKPERYDLEEVFFLESEGNGNVHKVPYLPPTPEQLAAEERKRAVESMGTSLAEALVDAGISPTEAVARLGAARSATAPVPPEGEPVRADGIAAPTDFVVDDENGPPAQALTDYPVKVAGNRWRLSNGTIFVGKKVDAFKAEDDLPEDQKGAELAAKATAAATPEI